MDYEKLIQQVYQRISLWNAKDSNYHNREYKAKLWSEVAENLNTTPEAARNKWSSLRDSFRREYKKLPTNKSETCEPKWPFYSRMTFLIDGSPRSIATSEVEIKCETAEPLEDSMDPLELPEPSSGQLIDTLDAMGTAASAHELDHEAPSTSSGEPMAKKKKFTLTDKIRFQGELLELEKQKISMFKDKLDKESKTDEDYCFAMSLVSSMRQVPEKRKILMRMKVMQVISEELPP